MGIKSSTFIAIDMLSDAHEKGFVSVENTFPNIPEIAMSSREVCIDVLNHFLTQKDSPGYTAIMTAFGWCAYAGMGAVYCWNTDWPTLRQKGILNTLTKSRGWDCMDEYVTDMIGIKFDTAESDELVDFLQFSSANAIVELRGKQDDELYAQLIECMRGAYMFGMVFEMDRLGMR